MEFWWIWVIVGLFLVAALLFWWRYIIRARRRPQIEVRPSPLTPLPTEVPAVTISLPPDLPDADGPVWRVLVVDDLPVWADTVRRYGSLFHCQVRHATGLSAAVRMLARWRPHLIILDLHMPRDPWQPIPALRGKYEPDQKTLAFCRQITSHPQLGHIIVVIASVEEQAEQQALAKEAGAHHFYTKGEFTVDQFQTLLQRVDAANQMSESLSPT